MVPPALPPTAADAAFYVVFGAFAVAFVVLSVITVGWALRQDRTGRERWLQRQQGRGAGSGEDGGPEGGGDDGGLPPPTTNGHGPSTDRPDPSRRPPR